MDARFEDEKSSFLLKAKTKLFLELYVNLCVKGWWFLSPDIRSEGFQEV